MILTGESHRSRMIELHPSFDETKAADILAAVEYASLEVFDCFLDPSELC